MHGLKGCEHEYWLSAVDEKIQIMSTEAGAPIPLSVYANEGRCWNGNLWHVLFNCTANDAISLGQSLSINSSSLRDGHGCSNASAAIATESFPTIAISRFWFHFDMPFSPSLLVHQIFHSNCSVQSTKSYLMYTKTNFSSIAPIYWSSYKWIWLSCPAYLEFTAF